MVVSLEGQNLESFVTFSPELHQAEHSTNVRASRKRSYGDVILESVMPEREKGANSQYDFTGRLSIELYDKWPPLASNYELQEDWFGDISLVIHSDTVDPKCFLTFSSTLNSARNRRHLYTHKNGDTIGQDNMGEGPTAQTHAGALKRKSSLDYDEYELRRSKRLSRKTQA
jgi:hypothetical protein